MGGINWATVLMLHGGDEQADASTTFLDDSPAANVMTANGNAQTDTGITKLGLSSILLDGTGDFLSTPDSPNWQLDRGSNANFWGIDFWVRFAVDPGADMGFIMQRTDNNNFWFFEFDGTNALHFLVRSGGVNQADVSQSWNPAGTTWYHIALMKNGTVGYLIFVDGQQLGATTVDTKIIPDFTGQLTIGRASGSDGVNDDLNGSLDEFRVMNGVCPYTQNFAVPTAPYSYGPVKVNNLRPRVFAPCLAR